MATKVKQPKKKFFGRVKEFADVITAVGVIGAALVGIGSWCTTQINASTNAKLDTISDQIKDMKLDSTRTQLLMMISDFPENKSEILKIAQYYFGDLKGDWYATDVFTKWAKAHGMSVEELDFMKEATR